MSFDLNTYSAAMDRFILEMERIHSMWGPEIGTALEPLCRDLGVAEFSVTYLEVPGGPPAGMGGPPPGVQGGPPAGMGGPPPGVQGGPPAGMGGPPPGVQGGPPAGMGGPAPSGMWGPPPGGKGGPAAEPIGGLMGGSAAGFPNVKPGESVDHVFWSGGSADRSRPMDFREVAGNGATAIFHLYPREGAPDWTDEERARLHVLEKAFFAFTGRIRLEGLAERLTYYDRDTEVHNVVSLMRSLGKLTAQGKIGGRYYLARFNLRRMAAVNDRATWKGGTEAMRLFVKGLEAMLGDEEYVCRLGGDNFTVVFLKEHLDAVVSYLSGTEVTLPSGKRMILSAYTGYYMVPEEGCSPTDMMDRAGAAMNIAKTVLKTDFVFFDEDLQKQNMEMKELEHAFPKALKNEEFQVWYQPKVNLRDYRLHGAEALCRWLHEGELIPPGRFIPPLEEGNNICLLDFYMLDHVCADIRRWLDQERPVVRTSVNLSRRHLGDSDLLKQIIDTIDKHQVPHEYIEIELTETTTDVDYGELKTLVTGLRDAGIHTSVDDFGIGYSSLNLIKELPWDVLKIDKSFLPDEERDDAQTTSVLKHVIALAQDIGLECIVEGVETAEQVRLLKENNCYMAQGFYFDRPLPREQFEKRLDALHDVL